MAGRIQSHRDLQVYRRAFDLSMSIFKISSAFPKEEKYSLTDQIRRSSRSVCANLAEAWRKRRYQAAFVSKLSDAEAEAAETQVWLEFSVKCGYADRKCAASMYADYNRIIATIVGMINHPETWIIERRNVKVTR
jgi:four helix bundle protein